MVILKDFYSQPKKFESSQTWISVVLDVNILDLQSSFFKITMMSNAQWAMDQPMDVNPMSKIWKKLYSNALLCVWLSKFMEVAKLAMVQIMGSMEDERKISIMKFMKLPNCIIGFVTI